MALLRYRLSYGSIKALFRLSYGSIKVNRALRHALNRALIEP
jgi:hypothetical protein